LSSVKSADHGAKALLERAMRLAQGTELQVGILEKGNAAANGADGLTVADVATFNEFGLGVPERSFIRGWYDENLTQNRADWSKLHKQVLRGEISEAQAMQRLGLKFVGDIQKRIVAGIAPENARSTVKAKGSSTPLVDSGQLKSSVTYEVKS
jgi:hypothetical protein